MTQTHLRVLLVEDSPSDALLVKHSLSQAGPGFEVRQTDSLKEALAQLRQDSYDVVLLDLGLLDSDGMDTLTRVSNACPQIPIVVLTGADDPLISLEAIRRGSQDYLVKGCVDGYAVAKAIRYAIERKQTESELRILNEELEMRVAERTAIAERRALQLRQLAAELELTEQRERRRLAMILHDGLQQTLVAAKLNLRFVERADDVHKATEEVSSLIDEAIETSRALTSELSPPMLFHGGLIPSLRWLIRWLHGRHGLTVILTAPEDVPPLPEEVIILLFRSVRELLFNVVKHAGSNSACVDVIRRDGQISVTINDEGKGFDPSQLWSEEGGPGGFGLFNIRERLGFLGGEMEIDSAPGRGSRFVLTVPYSAIPTAGVSNPQ